MEKQVTIYSYTKVFKWEKKIYSIGNINLPTPINPYDLLAVAGIAVFIFILSSIFPVLNRINSIVRYIFVPCIAASYLRKKKLDGKNPVKYLIGCGKYLVTTKGSFRQLFQSYPDKTRKLSVNWNCSMGR